MSVTFYCIIYRTMCLIGRVAIITLSFSQRFYRGVPLVEWLSFPSLIWIFHTTSLRNPLHLRWRAEVFWKWRILFWRLEVFWKWHILQICWWRKILHQEFYLEDTDPRHQDRRSNDLPLVPRGSNNLMVSANTDANQYSEQPFPYLWGSAEALGFAPAWRLFRSSAQLP